MNNYISRYPDLPYSTSRAQRIEYIYLAIESANDIRLDCLVVKDIAFRAMK